ncbi:NTP transferase domain-containing protein [Formicincola oecophyllae]|uniref:NTP transferase domain-containing protein n=2 Tax=Formicincola oecophyllae TaxID=2558361 RepID=A0A4Y6UCF1_9PROT|nr:NTP transferase domain-containing protein [Formicincola oecophyllae]
MPHHGTTPQGPAPFSTVILAGSRHGAAEPLARFGQTTHKALLPVGGVPMLERVVSALEAVPGAGKPLVSIEDPSALAFLEGRVTPVQACPTPAESAAVAVRLAGTPCLLTTADHALLQPEWVAGFIAKSRATGADITAAVALRETVTRDVPTTKRTFIRLSDAAFSGCNLFWLANQNALNVIDLWEVLQKDRKHPLRMAQRLGWGTLARALTRTLSVEALENRIEALTGAHARLIMMDDGRAAVDVDKVTDWHLAEKLLATPESRTP